ncbi:hypothetical protein [Tunturiibacter gelidiferens]|uniref:Transmembrane protein n=1 Tax=Tunturiibacter gelidiferens TaxID=3069689 RepID=A0AAU7Z5F8_9BACT
MSEDTAAVVVTIAFFAVMAAWIPLVECCRRAMRKQPERERSRSGRVVEMKPKTHEKKRRGYEAVVLITMVASVFSLGLIN